MLTHSLFGAILKTGLKKPVFTPIGLKKPQQGQLPCQQNNDCQYVPPEKTFWGH